MKVEKLLEAFPDIVQITNLSIKNREIKNITVVDSPDLFHKVGEHEMVISSGYILNLSEGKCEELIKLWIEGGFCAIGIKVDRFLKKLPESVIEYANKASVPIFHIPNRYSFSDFIIPAMISEMSNKVCQFKEQFDVMTRFVRLGIDGYQEDEILDYLHSIIDCDFTYYNYITDRRVLKGGKISYSEKADMYEYELKSKEALVGKFVLNISEKEITSVQKTAVEYAANVIILIYKEKFSVERAEQDLKQELVLDICCGNIKSMEQSGDMSRDILK